MAESEEVSALDGTRPARSERTRSSSRLRYAAIVWVLLPATTAWVSWFPERERWEEVSLDAGWAEVGGVAYVTTVRAEIPGDMGSAWNSPLEVFEDGVALEPAHQPASFVARRGGGAHGHMRGALTLSASDDSDPRTNGKRYTAGWRRPLGWPWRVLGGGLTLLGVTVVAFAATRLARGGTRGGTLVRGITAVWAAAVCTEYVGRCALEAHFARRGLFSKAVHDRLFDVGNATASDWSTLKFEPHPYIHYVLRGDVEGVDPIYRIRRSEPLRARERVSRRLLVLGGSTTYDTQIAEESQTWVAQLEARLREEEGSDVEVLNGGVGGYTVYENWMHYVTLLQALEPDEVLLFVGINDVHPRLYAEQSLDYTSYNVPSWSPAQVLGEPAPRWVGASALARYVVLRTQEAPYLGGIGGVVRRAPYPDPATWSSALERHPPEVFRRALDSLVTLLRAQGRRVYVLPQLYAPRDAAEEVFAGAVAEHNQIGREVAARRGATFVEGLLTPSAFEDADFNDNCHFNPRGAKTMSRLVFEVLERAEGP